MSSFELLWRKGRPAGEFAPFATSASPPPSWRGLVAGAESGGTAPVEVAPPASEREASDAAQASEIERALEQAYARGIADAGAAAEAAIREHQAAIAAALAEIERFRLSLRERWHDQILDLALEVARRVVRRELDARPEQWLELVRAGVHKALDRERICVRAGPVLYAFLAERRTELHAQLEEVKELELIEDPAISSSGCVLETSMGDIELGIESQIEAIRAELEELA